MEIEYEVWNDPILHVKIILEERRARAGTRYALVARTPKGTIILAVPADVHGPNTRNDLYSMIEPVQELGPGSYRVNRETEDTLLGAWGLR